MAKKVSYFDHETGKMVEVKKGSVAHKNMKADENGGGSFKHSGIGGTAKELKNLFFGKRK